MRAEPKFNMRPRSHLHCDGCGKRVPKASLKVVGIYIHCPKCVSEGVPVIEARPRRRMKRKE